MKRRIQRAAFFLALLFPALLLAGCKGESLLIRCDLDGGVQSLDPQFTEEEAARQVILNVFEGLVRMEPDGTIVPAAAQEYSVSRDGLVYEFYLREGMKWEDGRPVTAEDFAFALQRMFNSISPSPYASQYLAIENAQEILEGILSAESLGVSCPDERTLRITLETPDPSILQRLTEASAMPCNREFFEESKGRYGLTLANLNVNGPYYVRYWDNESYIGIRKNANYWNAAAVTGAGVNFYTTRLEEADRWQLFLEGRSDVVQAGYSDLSEVPSWAGQDSAQSTVWCLVFNQESQVFSDRGFRQIFCQAVDRSALEEELSGGFAAGDRMVPPSAVLLGEPYDQQVPAGPQIPYDPEGASFRMREKLAQWEGEAFPSINLLVRDEEDAGYLAGFLQQMWQRNIGAYLGLEVLSGEELEARLRSGDYDVALIPLVSSSPGPEGILQQFASRSEDNVFRYEGEGLRQILEEAQAAPSREEAASLYFQAEQRLAEDYAALPLWVQTTYFLSGEGVSGVEFFPDGTMYFGGARRQ